jgi:hypothetical protein
MGHFSEDIFVLPVTRDFWEPIWPDFVTFALGVCSTLP